MVTSYGIIWTEGYVVIKKLLLPLGTVSDT